MTQSGFEPETYCLEGSCSIQLSYWAIVGVAGFEPAASCSQSRRDNRATLHPEKKAERQGLEPWRQLPVDRLAICSVTTPAPLLFCKELNFFAVANVAFHSLVYNYLDYFFIIFFGFVINHLEVKYIAK